MNKRGKIDGIRFPLAVVITLALAVLGIILDQLADVIDYCQGGEPRISSIVMRSLSTFGWTLIEGYLLNEMWQYYIRKKSTKSHEEKPEPEDSQNINIKI